MSWECLCVVWNGVSLLLELRVRKWVSAWGLRKRNKNVSLWYDKEVQYISPTRIGG